MKDFCMKHPILTFLIIEDILVCIGNIACGKLHTPFVARAYGEGKESILEAKDIIDGTKPKNQIGFRVD